MTVSVLILFHFILIIIIIINIIMLPIKVCGSPSRKHEKGITVHGPSPSHPPHKHRPGPSTGKGHSQSTQNYHGG